MDPECGSTDEAKKVIRLLRVGISPTDCESAKRISSPGCVNDAENGEEVSFVPSGPSHFSHAAYIQVRLYHCRGREHDLGFSLGLNV